MKKKFKRNDKNVLTDFEKKLEVELKRSLRTKDEETIKATYSSFYKHYSNELRRMSVYKVHNYADISDVLMDTFVNFYNSLINDKIGGYCYKAYLIVMFYFICNKYNSEYDKRKNYIEEVCDIEEVAEYHDYHNEYVELTAYLDKILSPIEKEIVLRHIVRGESLLEIRELMNYHGHDIHKMYHKAINKLKKEMKGDYYGRHKE